MGLGRVPPCYTVLRCTSAYCRALPLCRRALLYLQELAEELTSVCQPPAPTEGPQEPQRVQRKRRRKKEEEDANSDDPTQDADFVPSKDVLLQAEEEEESDAALSEESELEPLRGHSVRTSSGGVRRRAFPLLLLALRARSVKVSCRWLCVCVCPSQSSSSGQICPATGSCRGNIALCTA